MSPLHLPQLSASLVAAVAPLLVVEVAQRALARFAANAQAAMPVPASRRRLRRATVAVLPLVAALALWLPPQSGWLAVVNLSVFALLSVPALSALGEIERASRHVREVRAGVRIASLTPRRVGQYLPWPWRLVPYVTVSAGWLLLAWRLTAPLATRELWVPLGFALAAGAFLLLYEVWITNLVTGPLAASVPQDSPSRFRSVRVLLAIEIGLITIMLAVTHVLLDVEWTAHPTWAAAVSLGGAVIAIVGCALALSSDLMRRAYVPAGRNGDAGIIG
jgi:hypothetical protein